jgi:hypothetical protein
MKPGQYIGLPIMAWREAHIGAMGMPFLYIRDFLESGNRETPEDQAYSTTQTTGMTFP